MHFNQVFCSIFFLLLLCIVLLSSAFSCLKAFWRSSWLVWIAWVSLRLTPLNLKVSKVSFIAEKQTRQISTPVMSIMCLKGPPTWSPTASDYSESSPWQAAGYACVDYFSALAAWHSNTRRRTASDARKWSSTRLPTRKSTNTWRARSRRDTTSFLLPCVAWRRPSFRRMVPLGCSRSTAFG